MKTIYQTKKQEVVILDLDGTLINSKPKMQSDAKAAFARLGYDIDISLLEGRQSWYDLANKFGFTKEQFDSAFDKRKSWEQSLRDGDVPLFNDTIPCLERLSAEGVELGLLTRSTPEYTKVKLDYHGLTKYFGDRIAVTQVTAKNKIPEALDLAKRFISSNLEGIFFVGDRVEDIVVAKDVNEKFNINTGGVYVNRDCSEVPKEISFYDSITSLSQLPQIVLGEDYGR